MSQCHQVETKISGKKRILLLGNPNVGKSVIFYHLTGRYATVSNYPGTTVAVASGRANFDEGSTIIDSPGVNNLIPRSEDEKVARDLLLEHTKTVLIQVADAKNLKRALLLSAQLAEAEVPFLLALNMADEAEKKGIMINEKELSRALGVPVVLTVATQGQGINQLKEKVKEARPGSFQVRHDDVLEEAISSIERLLPSLPIARRSLAIMLLSGDPELEKWLSQYLSAELLKTIRKKSVDLRSRYAKSIAYIVNRRRMQEIEKIVAQVAMVKKGGGSPIAELIGELSVHPVVGIPILLLVLYFFYLVVGVFGAGTVVEFVEGVLFGEYINPAATWLFSLAPTALLKDLMVGEYGLITIGVTYAVAIILPVVGFFFICFSLLEDIGYLPRLAVMANALLRHIGLSGKAVLPLILGLGCDTMATLTTRTLESKRERLLVTLLLALAIPCSAQMAVILALMAGISGKATILFFSLILINLLIVGYLASKVIPGQRSDFVLEMPPIRLPQPSNVMIKTLSRMEWYFKEAVPLFLLGTLILFILDKIGFLLSLERAGAPLVQQWLGLPAAATGAFIMGFLRRDYGAAGFFRLNELGLLDVNQIIISLVVITLFVPCIAQFFIMIKERGLKITLAIVAFIFPYSFFVGGVLNFILRTLGVTWQ